MRTILLSLFVLLLPATAHAQDAKPPETAEKAAAVIPIAVVKRSSPADFQADVLPILKKNCISCHNKTDQKGDLVLETPETIREGGKSGPAVVAGKSGESLLLASASHAAKPFMPPKNNKVGAPPLTPEELGLIKLWIDQGAAGKVTAGSTAIQWRPLPPGVNPIYASALSPDGRVAACGRANQIFVYNLAAGRLATRLADPALGGVADPDSIQSLAFDPRGAILASGGYRTVKLWRRPQTARVLNLADAGAGFTAIAASPDASRIATGTADGRIIVWNAADGKPARPLAAHAAAVSGILFSPDGARVFSSSVDGSLGVWSAADGFPEQRLGAGAAVHSIALAQKGEKLAAACADGAIRVWTLAAQPQPAGAAPPPAPAAPPAPPAPVVLPGHAKAVTSLAAAPGAETQIVSGGEDGTVRLWDLASSKELRQVNHGAPVAAVAVRPDGQAFASAGADKAAKLWNAGDGKLIAEMKGDPEVRFLADLKKREADFVAAIAGNAKNLLAAAEKKAEEDQKKAADSKAALEKLLADQTALAAAPAAQTKSPADKAKADAEAAAAKKKAEEAAAEAASVAKAAAEAAVKSKTSADEADAAVKAAQTTLEAAQKAAAETELPIRALAFSADGLELATAGDDSAIRTWSAKTGAPVDAARGHSAPVSALAYVQGKGFISSSADRSAALWDPGATWPLERVVGSVNDLSIFADRVTALDFSPDGALLATGGGEPTRSGELKVFKTADGTLAQAFPNPHSDVVFAVEFSPDGRHLASGAADKFVKVFEVASGKLVKAFEGHTHHVMGVSWKSDGKVIASAGADNVVKVWSLESGEQLRTIEGFGKQVTSIQFVAFTPNVVTSCGDRNVRLHNTDNGQNARTFGGATDYLYTAGVTPDGRVVMAGGHASLLQAWDGNSGGPSAAFAAP